MEEHECLERNKETVKAFHDLMFNRCEPAEAIERYAGDVYIQHNPEVADGKQAFVDYFVRMAAKYPGKRVEFVRAFRRGRLPRPARGVRERQHDVLTGVSRCVSGLHRLGRSDRARSCSGRQVRRACRARCRERARGGDRPVA